MEPVLAPDEMRAADDAAIASGTPGYELMDRAAYACAVVATLGLLNTAILNLLNSVIPLI